jgi:hypothetical protein
MMYATAPAASHRYVISLRRWFGNANTGGAPNRNSAMLTTAKSAVLGNCTTTGVPGPMPQPRNPAASRSARASSSA